MGLPIIMANRPGPFTQLLGRYHPLALDTAVQELNVITLLNI